MGSRAPLRALLLGSLCAARGSAGAAVAAPLGSGCGGTCHGTCFDGVCLFEGVDLRADEGRSPVAAHTLDSATAARAQVAAGRAGALVAGLKDAFARKVDVRRADAGLAAGFAAGAAPAAAVPVQARAAASDTGAALAVAAPVPRARAAAAVSPAAVAQPRQGVGSAAAAQMAALQSGVADATSFAQVPQGAFVGSGIPAGAPTAAGYAAAGAVMAQLQQSQAAAAQLANENMLLRQQLSAWHQMGAKIAEREARMAAFLAQRRLAPAQMVQVADAGGSPAQEQDSTERSLERDIAQFPHYVVIPLCLVLLAVATWLTCDLAGCLPAHSPTAKARRAAAVAAAATAAWNSDGSQGSLHSGSGGRAGRTVEVGELRLSGLCSAGSDSEVCVSLRAGSSRAMKTRAAALPGADAGNAFLSFTERFRVKTGGPGDKCIFQVVDHDALDNDPLAWAELSMEQFVDMACQNEEYFHLDLKVDRRRWPGLAGGSAPYISMRITEG